MNLVADVLPQNLASSETATLSRDGEVAWELSRSGEVFPGQREGGTAALDLGHGPMTFRAPSELGAYELCMAAWKTRDSSGPGETSAASRACTPVRVTAATGEQPLTFGLGVVAPAAVQGSAPFEVSITADVPLAELSGGAYANLMQHGAHAWVLMKSGETVRTKDFRSSDHWDMWVRPGHGPWTFTAPPNAGTYELCLGATRRMTEDGVERYGGTMDACTPLEVTAT